MPLVSFSGKNATAQFTPQIATGNTTGGNSTDYTYTPGNATEFNIKNWSVSGDTDIVEFKGSQTGDIPAEDDTYKHWKITCQIGFNYASSPFALGNSSGNTSATMTGGGNLSTGVVQSIMPGALLGQFIGYLHQSQRGQLDGKTLKAAFLKIRTVSNIGNDPENPKDTLFSISGSLLGWVQLPT